MSRDIYYYAVSPVEENLPDIINISNTDFPYAYTSQERAEDWEKKIGILKTIRTHTVNSFDVCEKKFGVYPASMHYPFFHDDEYQFYDDKGRMIGSLRSKDFEPYYYDLDKPSYVYSKKEIAGSENAYLFDSAESQIVSEDDLIAMLKKGISYLDTEMDGSVPDYYGEAVVAALKAMFAAKDGTMVYMEVD